MNDLISGALVMGYAVAGLYFLRFWRQTRDRLFAFFAVSFWILAIQRLALALTTPEVRGAEDQAEGQLIFYCIRLAAFLLILVAILDKNRTKQPTYERNIASST